MNEGETWGPHQRLLDDWARRNPNRQREECGGALTVESVDKAHALLVCDTCGLDVAVPALSSAPAEEPAPAGVQDDIPF